MMGPREDELDAIDPALSIEIRIAAGLYEILRRNGGCFTTYDAESLRRAFPGHEHAVDAQIAKLQPPKGRRDVLGPFRLVRQLGAGANGDVWEAIDSRLDRRVALKILRHGALGTPEREGKALALLDHPNVVRLYSVEDIEGSRAVVMEMVDGVSFENVVDACRKEVDKHEGPKDLRLTEAVERAMAFRDAHQNCENGAECRMRRDPSRVLGGGFFRDVAGAIAAACDGLAHAHDHSIVHRDMKPANVLVDRAGHVKITDFEFAKHHDLLRLSRTGLFFGTPYYASPEQTSGRHSVSASTDIWSVGVSLYQLVTLSVPFDGNDPEEVFARIMKGNFTRPAQINARVPADLERIIGRCLAWQPELRYPSAAALATDLRRFSENEGLKTASVTLQNRLRALFRHPRPRTRRTMTCLAVLVAIAFGAVVLADWRHRAQVGEDIDRHVRHATRALEAVIERREPKAMTVALSHADEAVRLRPDDVTTIGFRSIVEARLAYELTDDGEAIRHFDEARAIVALDRRDRVTAARAAFASGRLEQADRTYAGLQTEQFDSELHQERLLVEAYLGSKAIENAVVDCSASHSLTGCGPRSVIAIVKCPGRPKQPTARAAHELRFFPEGLDRQSVEWLVTPGDDADWPGALLLADVLETPGHEVILLGLRAIYVGQGPFSTAGPARWIEVLDPTTSCSVEFTRAQNDRQPSGTHMRLAAFDVGGAASIFASRFEALGSVRLLRERGLVAQCEGDWTSGSQIRVMKRIALSGGPALVVGLGEHKSFTTFVAAPTARGLRSTGSVTLGAIQDATSMRSGGRNVVLVAVGGCANGSKPSVFGVKNSSGWDYGVHALAEPTSFGVLTPLTGFVLPRPSQSDVKLHAIDLSGRPVESVCLFAEEVFTDAQVLACSRTHVLTLTGEPIAMGCRLRLPGSVQAVLTNEAGETDLVVKRGQSWSVVRCPR